MSKVELKGKAVINTFKKKNTFAVTNCRIYDIKESIMASGYPMTADLNEVEYSLNRAETLATVPIGSGHDCFLKGIIVNCDIRASNKWWVQFQRYSFQEIVSSQSTMHKIHDMDFDTCYNKYVTVNTKKEMKRLKQEYEDDPCTEKFLQLLYNNPAGMMITARVTLNYLQIKTMYKQRRKHKLPEWNKFAQWVKQLPKSYLITGGGEG